MLISKTAKIAWNGKIKKFYVDKGYIFTFMKDVLVVDVNDLSNGSAAIIEIECDYCHKKYDSVWNKYVNKNKTEIIKKDCCDDCKYEKINETFTEKYGVEKITLIPGAKEKQEETCLEKYGFRNPFQVEEFKEKIYQTNLEKYGAKSFTQTKEYEEKRKQTCLEKYGVENHMMLDEYKDMFRGEKSPVWKGGIHDERWDRLQPVYREWRQSVFIRDHFICRKCLKHQDKLEAHHIYNWNDYPDKRYDFDNGITFCVDCHIEFHRRYGKVENSPDQIYEFLEEENEKKNKTQNVGFSKN